MTDREALAALVAPEPDLPLAEDPAATARWDAWNEARVEAISHANALGQHDTSRDDAARALAGEVLAAMEQDCGPTGAEPYSSWAKQLAQYVSGSAS